MSDHIFYVNSASFIDVSVSSSLYVDVGTYVDFSQASQVTGSFVGNLLGNASTATTASFVISASHANIADASTTATSATSASHADIADIATSATSASHANIADTATSTITAQTASYVVGQKIKSGIVSGSSFSGNPQIYNVTFTSPFSTLYTATVNSNLSARSWLVQNLTTTGFTINSNTKTGVNGLVYWQAIAIGEFNS